MKNLIAISALALFILIGCSAEKPADSPKPEPTSSSTPSSEGPPQVTEKDLHLPFYPGAELSNEETMVVKTQNEHSIMAVFHTPDSPTQVKEFYESKVEGLKFSEFDGPDAQTMISETKADDGGKLAITIIKKKDEKTKISIGYGKY